MIRVLRVFAYELKFHVKNRAKAWWNWFRFEFPSTVEAYCSRFGHDPGQPSRTRTRIGGPFSIYTETTKCLRCSTVVNKKQWEA